jgi:hypothetical protein
MGVERVNMSYNVGDKFIALKGFSFCGIDIKKHEELELTKEISVSSKLLKTYFSCRIHKGITINILGEWIVLEVDNGNLRYVPIEQETKKEIKPLKIKHFTLDYNLFNKHLSQFDSWREFGKLLKCGISKFVVVKQDGVWITFRALYGDHEPWEIHIAKLQEIIGE